MRAWVVLAEDASSIGEVVPVDMPFGFDAASACDAVLVVGSTAWSREAIRRFRARGGRAPVVLLAGGETTPVAPYADDVVHAPVTEVALDECLARIEARRPSLIKLGAVDVDFARGTAARAGTEIGLTPTEVDLLHHLWKNRERTVSRDELHEVVWGYAPSVVSRAVDLAAHRLRPKIEPDPQAPRFLVTVRGLGYRLDVPDGSAHDATPAPAVTVPVADTTTFVGRAPELDALAREIERGAHVITVFGPPGVGKTRLARRFAATRPPSWFVDLTDAQGRPDILGAVARALRSSTDDPDRLAAALAAQGHALVVLDNAERVVDPLAELLTAWLPKAPDATFLATSRVRLRVEGEVRLELGPLSVADAAAVFCDRAAAIGRAFEIGDPMIAKLTDRLDRLPLAIELAAARADLFTPADMLDRLDQRFRLLADRRGDRTRSLEAALSASWDLLEPSERAVATQCAVFRGGFTVASAEAVVEAEGAWLPDVLRELTDQSILRSEVVDQTIRLTMFDSIQAFLWERVADAARVEDRHATHFLMFAERAGRNNRAPTARAAILRELPNLLHACAAARDVEVSARIAAALDPVLAASGPNGVLRELLDRVLVRGPSVAMTARLSIARARAHIRDGHTDAAERDIEQARALGERGTADWTEGLLAMHRGDFARAREWFESALAALEAEDDAAGQAVVLQNLGTIAIRERRLDDAAELFRRAIALHRSSGHQLGEGRVLLALANLAVERGDLVAARASYETAVTIHRAHGDRLAEGRLVANLASLDLDAGDLDAAHDGYVEALAIAREIGDRAFEGITLGNLGVVDLLFARLAPARVALEGAVALLASVQAWHPRAIFLAHLSVLVAGESGDEMLEEAERALAHDESGCVIVEIVRLHRAVVARIDPSATQSLQDLRSRASVTRSSDVRVALALLDRTIQMPGNR
jgi:predicted ATPase/DNA-binding winged helix-turn-helix (wHTH) protein/Tfp pilus assembly protein PilF